MHLYLKISTLITRLVITLQWPIFQRIDKHKINRSEAGAVRCITEAPAFPTAYLLLGLIRRVCKLACPPLKVASKRAGLNKFGVTGGNLFFNILRLAVGVVLFGGSPFAAAEIKHFVDGGVVNCWYPDHPFFLNLGGMAEKKLTIHPSAVWFYKVIITGSAGSIEESGGVTSLLNDRWIMLDNCNPYAIWGNGPL
jgi:hypothetical protein